MGNTQDCGNCAAIPASQLTSDITCKPSLCSQVVAFTANQIPGIDDRRYPPELSGPLYPDGIPIYPESELEHLVKKHSVDRCGKASTFILGF